MWPPPPGPLLRVVFLLLLALALTPSSAFSDSVRIWNHQIGGDGGGNEVIKADRDFWNEYHRTVRLEYQVHYFANYFGTQQNDRKITVVASLKEDNGPGTVLDRTLGTPRKVTIDGQGLGRHTSGVHYYVGPKGWVATLSSGAIVGRSPTNATVASIGFFTFTRQVAALTVGNHQTYLRGDLEMYAFVSVKDGAFSEQYDGDGDANLVVPYAAPRLELLRPTRGESWGAGSMQEIQWRSERYQGPVNLLYSTDAGQTWTAFALKTGNDGKESWRIPTTIGCTDRCRVVVQNPDVSYNNDYRSVSGDFTILVAPRITSFAINGGAATATRRTVTLDNTATGDPTHHVVSTASSFAGASWQAYSSAPSFTLPGANGTKRVYLKVRNAFGAESAAVSATIQLALPPPPKLTKFKINDGEARTTARTVTLDNAASGSPTVYLASELPTFAGAEWQAYSGGPTFTVSAEAGAKTVYLKVRNEDGIESAVVKDRIILDSSPGAVISGVVSTGEPVAGAAVSVRDGLGRTLPATTDGAGRYSVDLATLMFPVLVKVDRAASAGGPLYGVGSEPGVVNVHPLTHLLVEAYYRLHGLTANEAFDGLGGSVVLPTADEVRAIGTPLARMLDKWLVHRGVEPRTLDLVRAPFGANGTGFNAVLRLVHIEGDTDVVAVNDTTANVTQVSLIAVDRIASALTIKTTVGSPAGSTSRFDAVVVPTSAGLRSAMRGIEATLSQVVSLMNVRKSSLTAADLLPYFAPDFLNGGQARQRVAEDGAAEFRGVGSPDLRIERVLGYRPSDGVVTVRVLLEGLRGTQRVLEESDPVAFKQQPGGAWLFHGNQQIVTPVIYTAVSRRGDEVQRALWSYFFAVPSTIGSITVTGGRFDHRPLEVSRSVEDEGELVDIFQTSEPGGDFPSADTVFSFTVTPATGATQTYTERLSVSTSEIISVVTPTGTRLGDARLGQPLAVTWTLPTTFAVGELYLSGAVFIDQNDFCQVESTPLATSATLGSLTLPSTCKGQMPWGATICMFVTGMNGEETEACHFFSGP